MPTLRIGSIHVFVAEITGLMRYRSIGKAAYMQASSVTLHLIGSDWSLLDATQRTYDPEQHL